MTLVEMSYVNKERRKKDIEETKRRTKLRKEMKLGLPFNTEEGRKYQASFRKTGIR